VDGWTIDTRLGSLLQASDKQQPISHDELAYLISIREREREREMICSISIPTLHT